MPVAANGRIEGAARITYPTSAVDSRIRRYWFVLAAIAAIVIAVAVVVGLAVATFIARPLRRLEGAAAAVGAGDLTARAPEHEGPPEVRSLAAVFNETVAKLDQLLRSQEEFVADASHQLRTPLTALRLRLENLARDVASAGTRGARRRRRGGRAARSRWSRRCSRSRAPTRAASPRGRSTSTSWLRERVSAWSALADERGVDLTTVGAAAAPARTAEERLRQVLDNLLENALEVSPRGATITVETRSAPPWIELRIRDEGPGLEREERERAFDRFWRNRGGEGSGLGLAIVRRLVEQDGGQRRAARGAGPRARGGRPAAASVTQPGIFAPARRNLCSCLARPWHRARVHIRAWPNRQNPKQSRRAAFVLAAVLAATALTGGAAVTGLTRHAPPSGATRIVQQAPVVQQPAPANWEGSD